MYNSQIHIITVLLRSIRTVLLSTSVCLSVRPSVRLTKACIVTKRNNHLSIFQHRTTQQCFWFLGAKFRNLEFRGTPRTSVLKRGTPLLKAQIWPIICKTSKRCEIGCKSVLITNRKSHSTWAFDWYQNRWPWMTLNGVMTVILRFFAEFGSFMDRLCQSRRR